MISIHAQSTFLAQWGRRALGKTVQDHANMEYIKMQIPKKEKPHFSEFAFTTAVIVLAFFFYFGLSFSCSYKRKRWLKVVRCCKSIRFIFFPYPSSGGKGQHIRNSLVSLLRVSIKDTEFHNVIIMFYFSLAATRQALWTILRFGPLFTH